MRIVVPRETAAGERRVALVPETVGRLVETGFEVGIEAGAGERAGYPDQAYADAGATIVPEAAALYADCDVVLKVRRPLRLPDGRGHEAELISEGAALISFFQPLADPELVRILAERKITSFSLDLVPRITRAQKMDALSSQATVAGYRAVLEAAHAVGKMFPLMMTAAGTIAPVRVLVLGAGVAGLQAIATARRLGAVVQAFDIRPAAREQVESLGATFVGMPLEDAEDARGYAREVGEDVGRRIREVLARPVAEADVVITTAQVPGKPAPTLVTEEMVRAMRPGSVIVDLAAETGGNCTLTEPGRTVVHHGVMINGLINAPSAHATHASQMLSRNIAALLLHVHFDGAIQVDLEDEITRACCVTHAGEVLHEGARALVGAGG